MSLFSSNTLNALRQQVAEGQPKSADFQTLLTRVDAWVAQRVTIPTQSGGWIHNYICPDDWMPLIYDGDKPHEHVSPLGKRVEGAAYDEAWLAWRHRQIADMSREVALAFVVTGKQRYVDEVERVLLAYAQFYANFEGADSAESWMITARVFNQALTEALWALPLIHAFDLVAHTLPASSRKQIETDFFRPLADTMAASQDALIAKDHIESNYMAWFNAALGTIGYAIDDAALVERAIDGPGGFVKHLDVGVLPDGMQYEVTPYYHNFVVLAYVILAEAAAANGRNLYAVRGAQGQSIQTMWRALTQLTLPDGTIADLGDGSYWVDSVYDRELAEVYEIACARDEADNVASILTHAYQRWQRGRDHWAALLYGTTKSRGVKSAPTGFSTKLLPDAGVALLQASDKLAAVAPFGAYRGSHSHGDHLSLQVWPFSNDAGCVLYGIPARRDWYQDSYAHNGLVIDGQSQSQFAQAEYASVDNDNFQMLSMHATDAYGESLVSRMVSHSDNSITDVLTFAGESASHVIDWVYHIDGDIKLSDLETESVRLTAGQSSAAQQIDLHHQRKNINSAEITLVHQQQAYKLNLLCKEPFDLLLGTAPGTSWNPTQRRHVIIGRTIGHSQTYRMTISHD